MRKETGYMDDRVWNRMLAVAALPLLVAGCASSTTWSVDECQAEGTFEVVEADGAPRTFAVAACKAHRSTSDGTFEIELRPDGFDWIRFWIPLDHPEASTSGAEVAVSGTHTPGPGQAGAESNPGSYELVPNARMTIKTFRADETTFEVVAESLGAGLQFQELGAGTDGQWSATFSFAATGHDTPAAPSSGGAAGCADNGASCSSDSRVTSLKRQCESGPPGQRACYCAAVATADCFIRKGCYQEAGAATSTTRADLERVRNSNNENACALGGCCF